MGIKALLLLPAILAFPGYLHGVAALPGTLPGPDTLYRDSTYLRVINEGSTRLNCYLSYPQGGWRVESTYGNNSSELARLARFIRTSLSDSLIYVREITLTGYCSIEGSYAHNERLARRRANGFRGSVPLPIPAHRFPAAGKCWKSSTIPVSSTVVKGS